MNLEEKLHKLVECYCNNDYHCLYSDWNSGAIRRIVDTEELRYTKFSASFSCALFTDSESGESAYIFSIPTFVFSPRTAILKKVYGGRAIGYAEHYLVLASNGYKRMYLCLKAGVGEKEVVSHGTDCRWFLSKLIDLGEPVFYKYTFPYKSKFGYTYWVSHLTPMKLDVTDLSKLEQEMRKLYKRGAWISIPKAYYSMIETVINRGLVKVINVEEKGEVNENIA